MREVITYSVRVGDAIRIWNPDTREWERYTVRGIGKVPAYFYHGTRYLFECFGPRGRQQLSFDSRDKLNVTRGQNRREGTNS